MNSHFFYPTASGSLGEARRLCFEETHIKREMEELTAHSSGEPSDDGVRSKAKILIAPDNEPSNAPGSAETARDLATDERR